MPTNVAEDPTSMPTDAPAAAATAGTLPAAATACSDRPTLLRMKYNGGDCSQSTTMQSATFTCSDSASGGPPALGQARIVVRDNRAENTFYFSGTVQVDDTFDIYDGGDRLASNLAVGVFSSVSGELMQSIQFQGSCAFPLFLNDKFGSVEVIGWENEAQGEVYFESKERDGGGRRRYHRALEMRQENEANTKTVRRPSKRALQQAPIPGAACYAGLTSCPTPSAPHCTIDAKVSCTAFDDPTMDCNDAAALLPNSVTAADIGTEACQLKLVYSYLIDTKTSTASSTTWALRTRKGDEPDVFARPREYDWFANNDVLKDIPGAGRVPFSSAEEVIVDFCKQGTYKTLAEFVVLTDGNTICTDRNQYKLKVAGL